MPPESPSISELEEAALVDRVLSDQRWRHFVGLPCDITNGVRAAVRVPLKLLGGPGLQRGDVDVLAMDDRGPSAAVAIEVKRVKAVYRTWTDFTLNKVNELKKGAAQANRLVRVGFCRVFLQVFVVSDTRSATGGRWNFGGVPLETTTRVFEVIRSLRLDPSVGVMLALFDQPVDKHPLMAGAIGFEQYRPAVARSQPEELTERISQLDFASWAPKTDAGYTVVASFWVPFPPLPGA